MVPGISENYFSVYSCIYSWGVVRDYRRYGYHYGGTAHMDIQMQFTEVANV